MRAIDIISIIIILSLSICSWGGNAQAPHRYTGFRLILEWAPAFCNLNPTKCNEAAETIGEFTIHGLWPVNNAWNSIVPPCGGGSPFNVKYVGNLQDMNALWPSFEFTSNQDLWKHEWEKHGICSESTDFKQTDYFKNAIALTKKADVLGALNKEGITPDAGKTLAGKDIKAAIEKHLEGKPKIELVCQNKVFLGVNLCVNMLATKFVNCPSPVPPAPRYCENAKNLKFIPLPPRPSVSLYTPI